MAQIHYRSRRLPPHRFRFLSQTGRGAALAGKTERIQIQSGIQARHDLARGTLHSRARHVDAISIDSVRMDLARHRLPAPFLAARN